MPDFLRNLFSADFMPHGYCMRWDSGVIWLHVVSDALTALAYFTIPFTLLYFVRRRRDLAFHWMFLMFGAFILACGATHVLAIWTLWQPVYRLDGLVKAATALASVPTALLLMKLIPKALALPSPSDLAREVVDRKRVEDELRVLNAGLEARVAERTESLQRYNEALRRVAYIASHDLQEPLRNVVAFNQLLARKYGDQLDADGHEYLRYSLQGAQRMENLVADVMEYARSIETASHVPAHPVQSSQCLDGALLNLESTIREHAATIQAGTLPTVLAEPVQLQQVFQNLISNAIKYRHPQRPSVITIDAFRDGSSWLFTVADNGIGFDPVYKEHIFEAFRRLHDSAVPGSGVGLAICKTAIESFGGYIWAEGHPGSGAVFHFTLPAAPARPGEE